VFCGDFLFAFLTTQDYESTFRILLIQLDMGIESKFSPVKGSKQKRKTARVEIMKQLSEALGAIIANPLYSPNAQKIQNKSIYILFLVFLESLCLLCVPTANENKSDINSAHPRIRIKFTTYKQIKNQGQK